MISKDLDIAIRVALNDALRRHHEYATIEHLTFALLHDDETVNVLRQHALLVANAIRQNRPADYSVMTMAMIGITIPSFVTAPLLQLVFGIYGVHIFGLDLTLPVGGWAGGNVRNMILPVIVLSLGPIAVIARLD